MHSFARFICIGLLAICLGASAPDIQSKAEQTFHWAQTGNFDRSQLTPHANAALTPSLARGVSKDLQKLGTPVSFALLGTETLPKYTAYTFLVTLTNGRVNWFFALDNQGKLAAAFIQEPTDRMAQAPLLAALAKKAQSGAFSGSVLVAKAGKSIFEHAYGYADRARKIPNTLDTKFRIGSMNKMFTAVAVLQLVQAGKISLQDSIGKYLSDYPNKRVASQVTIHDLLTHTGGTGDIFGPAFTKHRLDLRTLQDYETLYGARGPEFTPGSKWEYSNYGFILLGLVIEKVSGESYYDYVREHVYAPAGMTSSGSEPEDVTVPNRSIGYTKSGAKWIPNTDTLPFRGTSAGGGYSTVGDLLKFANALQAHKLLNARYTELLITPKVHARGFLDYAYGIGVKWQNGVVCFGHTGGAPGMSGDLEICPSLGYTVVALSNSDPPAADLMTQFVIWRLPLPANGLLGIKQASGW